MEKQGGRESQQLPVQASIEETFRLLGFDDDGVRTEFLQRVGGQPVEQAPGRPSLPMTQNSLPMSK